MINLKSTVAGVLAGALILFASSTASAATFLDGVMLRGLTIGAVKYDVTFTSEAFDGALTFKNRQEAGEALATILSSSEYQAIVQKPGLRGILVPYGSYSHGFTAEIAGGSQHQDGYLILKDYRWSDNGFTLATFLLSSAVPEPATWAMMIVGFGAVGSMVRTSRRRNVLAVA